MATTSKRWRIILAMALATMAVMGRGQTAMQWTSYKISDGLPEPVLHAICFTPQGKLIAAGFNAPLAAELDGYSVSNFPAPEGCMGRICESPGGQRWAMVSQGLAEFKNDTWLVHSIPEIHAELRTGWAASGSIPAFLPVRQGTVLFLLPDGLWEFLGENPDAPRTVPVHAAAQTQIGRFTGMAVARDEGLWISGTRGLARVTGPARNLEPKTTWQEHNPPDSLRLTNFTQPEPDNDGGITLIAESAANGQKVVVTFDGHAWVTLAAEQQNFLRAWRGPDRTIWAATANALFQWVTSRTNWVEHEEVSGGQIFDIALEPDGAFWLATSDGLFRGAMPLWNRPATTRNLEPPAGCLVTDEHGWLYFVAGDKLHVLKNGLLTEFPLPSAVENLPGAPALFASKNGSLLIDTGNALLQFNPADSSFKPLSVRNEIERIKPLGTLSDGTVCLFNRPYLVHFAGDQLQSLANPPPIRGDDGTLTTLFTTRSGDLWIGGLRLILWRHNDKWERFASENHTTPESVVGFAEMQDGKILCATSDQLWQFDGSRWTSFQARFNHINCLMQCRDGTLWLASNGGLFRYCGGIWMENGEKEGLPGDTVTALCENQQGQVWAATPHGLAVFHREADSSPPRSYVHWLGESERRLSEGETLNLLFDGQDKWKITPRERLLYSYRLDQREWSPFQDLNMFSFASPLAGRHLLQVRAMDRNGNVDPVSATLDFTVVTPWFHDARLWFVLFLGVAAAVFFAGIALNRHRQLIRSYAAVEQKVADRTRELEIATRELLHSQKMNALGTLAAGIAHDFNNILSIIKGSAQIIEDNLDRPEKIQTRVSRIKTVVQQGAEIVDAMLGFGRTSDSPAQPCNINTVVAETIKLLGDRFLREVEVKFERAEMLPEICTSREFIQQILLNFIFNAADSMSSRKRITVNTQTADKLPADIFLHPTAATSFVLVSVQDQGSGIAPEIKARIFEPFFTTKALSARRGTGLGLSMVYELAKKLGAGLAVQSAVGKGSTFTLILPVKDIPAKGNRTAAPVETLHT